MSSHKLFYRSLAASYIVVAFVVDYFYEQPHDLALNIMGAFFMLLVVGLAWINYWIGEELP